MLAAQVELSMDEQVNSGACNIQALGS